MQPWSLMNRRAALGLMIPKASASGGIAVEDLVAVHAFSLRNLPVDEGGYEVVPHLGSEPFLRLCAQ